MFKVNPDILFQQTHILCTFYIFRLIIVFSSPFRDPLAIKASVISTEICKKAF